MCYPHQLIFQTKRANHFGGAGKQRNNSHGSNLHWVNAFFILLWNVSFQKDPKRAIMFLLSGRRIGGTQMYDQITQLEVADGFNQYQVSLLR
jgi:hypothetical protein